jgi:lipopolysaccharide export LptBFGC system permease protein LptF
MNLKVYIYADLLNETINHTNWDMWGRGEAKETGIYQSEHASWQLLDVREFDFDETGFDFREGKLYSLERKLQEDMAASHIRQENLKAQIQELKCLGHDDIELGNYKPQPSQAPTFDDDIPF